MSNAILIQKDDIFWLTAALHLPDVFCCQNGLVVDTVKVLCIALKRFAYPCRYADLFPRFGRPVSQLCMVANPVLDHVNYSFGYLLTDLDQPWLSRQCLEIFANTIHKGAPLDNCWSFIDGTLRPISRPSQDQRIFYNVHKRIHAIEFQSGVTPIAIESQS